jgi:hypothetical protein
MTINKICFYNRWHNGDVFSGKGYMQDLIRQLPDIEFSHSQVNKIKTMGDMPFTHLPIDQIPVTDSHRVSASEDTIYINTWVGGYKDFMFPNEEHANYPMLNRMWMYIYDRVAWYLDRPIEHTTNLFALIPTTDWSKFNIAPALAWLEGKGRIALFCNGIAQSSQSQLGTMGEIIKNLAQIHPDVSFVCTTKFSTEWFPYTSNIYFTDDIFAEVEGGDLNEIGFLSTKAELIVGKNSGPFMFSHVRENIANPNQAFLSLSHRPSDSYLMHVIGFPCRYFHYSREELHQLTFYLNEILNGKGKTHNAQMQILD